MKIDKVSPGMVLWTTVSGAKVEVRVIRIAEQTKHGYGRKPDRAMRKVFVARTDTGAHLPKARIASALHETPNFLAESPEDARERVAAKVKREAGEVTKLAKSAAIVAGELTPPPPVGKTKKGKFRVRNAQGFNVKEGLLVGPYFAVEKLEGSVKRYGSKWKPYTLTHTPTGFRLTSAEQQKGLVGIARELETRPGIESDKNDSVMRAIGDERVAWITSGEYYKPFAEWIEQRKAARATEGLRVHAVATATKEYKGKRFQFVVGERYGQEWVVDRVIEASQGSFAAELIGLDVRGETGTPTNAQTIYLRDIRFLEKGESADLSWIEVTIASRRELIMRRGMTIWHITEYGHVSGHGIVSAHLWTTGPSGRPPGKPMIQPSNPQEFPALAGKSGTERAMAFAESGGAHTGPAKAPRIIAHEERFLSSPRSRMSLDDTSVKPTTPIEFQRDAYEVQWADVKFGAIRGFGGEPVQALKRAIDYAKRTSAERARRAIEVFEADKRSQVVWRSGTEGSSEPRQGSFQDVKRSPEWVRRSRDKGLGEAAFSQIAAASAEREWEKSGTNLGFDAWKREQATVKTIETAKPKESSGLMAHISAGAFKESVDHLNRIYGESARKSARILAEALKRSPGLRGNLDDRTYRLIELWSKPGELTPAERLFEQSNLLYRDAVKAVQEGLPNAGNLVRDAQDALNQAAVSGYGLRAIGPLSRDLVKLEAALQLPKYETWMGTPETVSEQTAKPRAVRPPKSLPPLSEAWQGHVFPIGARVLIDGDYEAIVKEAHPEGYGCTSFAFPHYHLNVVGGDKNVAISMKRVGVERASPTLATRTEEPRAVAKPKRQSPTGRTGKYMTSPPFGSHTDEPIEVEGVLVGKYLGVHAEKDYRKTRYSLTHIPTSLRAGLFTKKDMAMRVARTLDERVGERLASTDQDEVVKAIGQNLAHWMRSRDDGEYDAWKLRNGIVEPGEAGKASCPPKALPPPSRSRDKEFGAASDKQIRRGVSGKTKKAFSDAGCRLVRHYLENTCKK